MNLTPWERVRKLVAGTGQIIPERRRCVRQKIHAPAFASFDGATGGMILDLSEHGMSMQTAAPLKQNRRIKVNLNLPEPVTNLETTGYIAWADAFGRAGVRFSDIPEDARRRLKQWLSFNAATPSRRAPKLTIQDSEFEKTVVTSRAAKRATEPLAITIEPETKPAKGKAQTSSTVQYEFGPVSNDLSSTLRHISERARVLTRGTGAAIALASDGAMLCRASSGVTAPPIGTSLDINAGLSGVCIRTGRALRCDDTETDPRVDLASSRQLGIRSVLAAPIQYERDIIGLLEVFSTQPCAFDEGDVAVAERLAQTVILAMSKASVLEQ
jgi:GAF domain-containing protein/PilZ domain-containing protein